MLYQNRCKENDCNIRFLIYNYKGENSGIYCKEHCLENMITYKR